MNMSNAYMGIHPGKIISRYINRTGICQRELAAKSGIPFQTINAIIQGHRKMTVSQSVLLDKVLGFEMGFFAVIQAYYYATLSVPIEIKKPLPKIRPVVFWDIDMSRLSWSEQKDFIITRVKERGNVEEIKQVLDYYGE